jgi:hypothetical protein
MKVEAKRWEQSPQSKWQLLCGARKVRQLERRRLFGFGLRAALANVLSAALVSKAALAGGEVVARLVELLDGLAGAGAALALVSGGGLDGLALVLAAALIAKAAAAGEIVLADFVGGVLTTSGFGLAAADLAVPHLGLHDGALVLAAAVVAELAAAALEVAAYLLREYRKIKGKQRGV